MKQELLSRRTFLKTGTLATSALILADQLTSLVEAEEKPEYSLGIQSYTFREFKLEPALKKISDLKLKNVEFFPGHIPVTNKESEIKAVKKLCGDYGVVPLSFGVGGYSKNHEANKKIFEFAAAMGMKYLSADPTPDAFDSLDKLTEEYKIAIGIHPHGPAGKGLHRWYSAEIIMKAVRNHSPLIGSCLDTGHLIRSEQMGKHLDPAKQVLVMGARNFGLHLKDHDNKRRTDVVFGKDGGVLNVLELLQSLQKVKFKGYIAIEYEANSKDPSKDVAACIEVFQECVKKLA